MNADEHLFRRTLTVAIEDDGRMKERAFWHKYSADDLFSGKFADDDTPAVIAAKGLEHLCSEDGKFNGCMPGLVTAMRFLEKKSKKRSPKSDEEVEACQRDLATRNFGDTQDLTDWANTHYE